MCLKREALFFCSVTLSPACTEAASRILTFLCLLVWEQSFDWHVKGHRTALSACGGSQLYEGCSSRALAMWGHTVTASGNVNDFGRAWPVSVTHPLAVCQTRCLPCWWRGGLFQLRAILCFLCWYQIPKIKHLWCTHLFRNGWRKFIILLNYKKEHFLTFSNLTSNGREGLTVVGLVFLFPPLWLLVEQRCCLFWGSPSFTGAANVEWRALKNEVLVLFLQSSGALRCPRWDTLSVRQDG